MFGFLDEYLVFSRENGKFSSEKDGGMYLREDKLCKVFQVFKKRFEKKHTHMISFPHVLNSH